MQGVLTGDAMDVRPEDLVLDAARWLPAPVDESFKAMTVLPGTGPAFEVIRVVGESAALGQYRPLRAEFTDALTALKTLQEEQRIGIGYAAAKPATLGAVVALHRLVEALRQDHEERLDAAATPLERYLDDPPRLQADLARAIERFTERKLQAETKRLHTFSLILFRDDDLGGELARSLTSERDQWRNALTPAARTRPDTHLAVIPPPTAHTGIEAIAAAYGCHNSLPCVVFVRDLPKPGGDTSLLTRLSVRRLQLPPPTIPQQLQTIYRSVYDAGRLPGQGTAVAAVVDKLGATVHRHVDAKVALGILAGAIGGSGMVDAVDLIFRLLH